MLRFLQRFHQSATPLRIAFMVASRGFLCVDLKITQVGSMMAYDGPMMAPNWPQHGRNLTQSKERTKGAGTKVEVGECSFGKSRKYSQKQTPNNLKQLIISQSLQFGQFLLTF